MHFYFLQHSNDEMGVHEKPLCFSYMSGLSCVFHFLCFLKVICLFYFIFYVIFFSL
jgi:hypothetical protein